MHPLVNIAPCPGRISLTRPYQLSTAWWYCPSWTSAARLVNSGRITGRNRDHFSFPSFLREGKLAGRRQEPHFDMNYEHASHELWVYPRFQHQLQTIDTYTPLQYTRTLMVLLAVTLFPLLTRCGLGVTPRALIALSSSFLCILGMYPELYQHLLPFFPILTSCALSFPSFLSAYGIAFSCPYILLPL